jgi:hypothetical protein
MGVAGERHAPAALPPEKRPGTHCTGGWVGPRPVWTGAENLSPTGIRSPDRPASSESLYRLSYRGPRKFQNQTNIWESVRIFGSRLNVEVNLNLLPPRRRMSGGTYSSTHSPHITSALSAGQRSTSPEAPSTHSIGRWLGPRAGLGALQGRKSLASSTKLDFISLWKVCLL